MQKKTKLLSNEQMIMKNVALLRVESELDVIITKCLGGYFTCCF